MSITLKAAIITLVLFGSPPVIVYWWSKVERIESEEQRWRDRTGKLNAPGKRLHCMMPRMCSEIID